MRNIFYRRVKASRFGIIHPKDRAPMRQITVRILMSLAGVLLCSIAVGIFTLSALGTDPFTCFVTGIATLLNSSYGVFYPILCAVMLVIVFIFDKHKIGMATLFNLFLTGFFMELTMDICEPVFAGGEMWIRITGMLTAIVITCFAASLYFTADLGVSAYDAQSLILGDKTPIPFKYCRIGTDVLCVIVGFCFARSTIGIGTIITAFFMGPLIEFFNVHVSRPLVYEHQWSHMDRVHKPEA